MTPKEKAIELIGKFESKIRASANTWQANFPDGAKQCALICVEEVMNMAENHSDKESLNYWNQVNSELLNQSLSQK